MVQMIGVLRLLFLCLLLLFCLSCAFVTTTKQQTTYNNNNNNNNNNNETNGECRKLFANYTGDFLLGGLFPIHNFKSAYNSSNREGICGEINSEDGVQVVEAVMFALDRINSRPNFLNFTLGLLAVDTCEDPEFALTQALDFMQVLVSSVVINQYTCNDGSLPSATGPLLDLQKIVGVIGASQSDVSISVASFLKLFKVPQVSYGSTSSELTNIERFSYFLRTVPNDRYITQAIVSLLKRYTWTWVVVLSDDTSYGKMALDAFEKYIDNHHEYFTSDVNPTGTICISKKIYLELNGNDQSYANAVNELEKKSKIDVPPKVVVTFLAQATLLRFLKELNKNNNHEKVTSKFLWIGTDTWGGSQVVRRTENIPFLERTIIIMPSSNPIEDFQAHLNKTFLIGRDRNPWIEEYLEIACNCTFEFGFFKRDGCVYPGYDNNTNGNIWCEHIEFECIEKVLTNFRQMRSLQFVVDAVEAYAHALKNIFDNMHSTSPSPHRVDGPILLKALKEVHFNYTDRDGSFFFKNGTEGRAFYSILAYHGTERDWLPYGHYDADSLTSKLTIYKPFRNFTDRFAPSHCARICNSSLESTQFVLSSRCCWTCTPCNEKEYIVFDDEEHDILPYFPEHEDFDDDDNWNGTTVRMHSSECRKCPEHHIPNADKSDCVGTPLKKLEINDPISVLIITLSSIGLLATVIVAILFGIFHSTPVFKASGRESSVVLLIGIALGYISAIIFMKEPSMEVCAIFCFAPGLCCTITNAAIFAKTNRIARIFDIYNNFKKKSKRLFISPMSQLLLMGILVLIDLTLMLLMLAAFKPKDDLYYTSSGTSAYRICGKPGLTILVVGLMLPLILLVISTIYAFRIRKTPVGFNETRSLLFMNYVNCLVFFSCVTLVLSLQLNQYSTVYMSVLLILNGYNQLVALFAPRIYTALFRPHKNSPASMMRPRRPSNVDIAAEYSSSNSNNAGTPAHVIYSTQGQGNRISSPSFEKRCISTQTAPVEEPEEEMEHDSPSSSYIASPKKSVSFNCLNDANDVDTTAATSTAASTANLVPVEEENDKQVETSFSNKNKTRSQRRTSE